MRYSLIAQGLLIVVALTILVTFVKPMFADIGNTQNELSQYTDALAKATQFNRRLQELVSIRDGFPAEGMQKLEQFIPSSIDALHVMENIENIFALKNIPIKSMIAKDEVLPFSDVSFEGGYVDGVIQNSEPIETTPDQSVHQRDFEVTFVGTYANLKDILPMIESNAGLLEIVELDFEPATEATVDGAVIEAADKQDGVYIFKMTIRAYSLATSST
jgi:hypothetical protein